MSKPVAITKTTELLTADQLDAAKLFEPKAMDNVLDQVRDTVMEVERDVTTAKGRKNIASLAHAVSRTKVAIDTLGKETVATINGERKKAREMLDNLRDYAREPLTVWEAEEAKRKEAERIEQEKREAEERLAAEIDQAWDDAHAEYDLREREAAVAAREAELKAKEEAQAKEAQAKEAQAKEAETKEAETKEAPEPEPVEEDAAPARKSFMPDELAVEPEETGPVVDDPEPQVPAPVDPFRQREMEAVEAIGRLLELETNESMSAYDKADMVITWIAEGRIPYVSINVTSEVKGAGSC